MDIPDYEKCMLPVLRVLADGRPRHIRDVTTLVADEFGLTPEARATLLPSGRTAVIRSRVGWAKTYLLKARLLESPKRGLVQLAARGRTTLAEAPARIDNEYLERFPEFVEFRVRSGVPAPREAGDGPAEATDVRPTEVGHDTPEERIERAHRQLRQGLEAELLEAILAASPEFFEQLVIDLLVAMGYGGDRREAARVGRSGDGGIDGIIKEDRLGLDAVYVQAKRWKAQSSVGAREIREFAGALQPHRARKGVFITTTTFSRDAREFAEKAEAKIVLIDGADLARLMIDHGIGVTTVERYEIKRLDSDYFEGE